MPGNYTTMRKFKVTTPPSPMNLDNPDNLGQMPMKLKEKVQDGGQNRETRHEAGQSSNLDMVCNTQQCVTHVTEVRTKSMQGNNFGDYSTFKPVFNTNSITDTPQKEFELHSTTINTQSVVFTNHQGFNAQLKEIDMELAKHDNCKEAGINPNNHKPHATKLVAS